MEKYTVDIDKVLDDFEETEALKISTSQKHTDTSLLQPCILDYDGDHKNGNEGSEVDRSVEDSAEYRVNSCDKTSFYLDGNTSMENTDTNTECLNQLETCDNGVVKSSFNQNIEVPINILLKPGNSDHASNECVSVVVDDPDNISNEYPCSTTSGINEIKIDRHEDSVSVHSVSVSEKDSDSGANLSKEPVTANVCESHAVDENVLLIHDNPEKNVLIEHTHVMHLANASTCDIDTEENSQATKETNGNAPNLNLLGESNKAVDFTGAEASTNVILLDGGLNSNFSDQKCDTYSKTIINEDALNMVGVCSSVSGAVASVLSEEGLNVNDSHSVSNSAVEENNGSEKSVDYPGDIQNDIGEIVGISDDEIDGVGARARYPEFELISDVEDDSGVSSDEDGTSPLFYFNNRRFNFNRIQINVRSNRVLRPRIVHRNNNVNVNVDLEAAKIPEVNDDTGNLPQPEDTENQESAEIQQNEDFPSSSENVACVQSPNKFTGARPKSESLNQASVDTSEALTSEKIDFGNKDLNSDSLVRCSMSSESQVEKLEEKKREVIAEASRSDDCDNLDKSSDAFPVNISAKTELVNSCCTVETDTKCDYEVNNESLMADTGIESSVLASDAKDNLPQRLPRPTTLDLPSRHLTVSPVAEENGALLPEGSNLVSVTGPDFLPNDMTIDDSVSEASQSVRQQPRIGLVKPFWIPDADAPNCMHCGMKFTVIKRRHHCRACGKVLCSRCCNLRAKLAYLNKEDRICHPCFEILSSTSQNENVPAPLADSQSSSSCGSSPNFSPSPQIPNANFNDKNTWRPHPNNPDDYCSTIPPLQQIQLAGTRPPPTVMVPIGVLKRGNKPRREPKQVIFSDGIRPGGDLTDLTEPVDVVPVYRRMGRKRVEKAISGDSVNTLSSLVPASPSQRTRQKRVLVSDEEGPLPPVVLEIVDNEKLKDEKLDWNQLLERMQDDDQKPVNFALLKNMHLFVKLTKLDCCYGKECWCFTSHGLCAVGQDEVMVILERLPDENTLPRGIVKLFTHIYDSASKGTTFEDLGHIIFPEQILGSSDHRGFLFVRPTFQCLSKLVVPNTPFLVAILIHKWEVPWAKVFPLRLMLRLGAECRYYPCALVSVRHRKPVFFEIGQTIMSVLSDLRNYQFTIPVIPGLVVHMEEKKTCVNIPRNRYERVMKILNSNNVEHVLALGSNFSSEADSHLVCMQKEEGDYQTQAINIENTTRRVTGASFIVFSGALKSSSGLSAKFSIVEDGLLVQIPQETMVALHMALRDMKDLTIECGQINAAEPEEVVIVQWTRDDKKFNIGVRSPIDCKSLEGVPNVRIHTSTDYAGENYLIRWTEVFFLEVDESSNSVQHELVDPCRLAETVAQSCCMALAPYLDQLAESELTKIGLRVTLDSERDRVEYDVGSRGKPLPAMYMNALDCGLIPVILRLSGSAQSEPISFELIFHILIK